MVPGATGDTSDTSVCQRHGLKQGVCYGAQNLLVGLDHSYVDHRSFFRAPWKIGPAVFFSFTYY